MRSSRGVSLIEALVAVAVMGFGMIGIVALQSSMRQNGDITKQRSEAVRIAQETIEVRRAFSVMASASGAVAYADIVSHATTAAPGITSNTVFNKTETVTDATNARAKTLTVDVTWQDRTGQDQSVRLSSNIAGISPEIGASLGLPSFGGRQNRPPGGRHAAIPPSAIDQGDGTSRFAPPGAGTVTWVFNNTTGVIVQNCVGLVCTNVNALLLAGFVNFATGSSAPTPAQSENPPSTAMAVEVVVQQTVPTSGTVDCFEYVDTSYVLYFCAVPVDTASGNKWSGRSELTVSPLATSISDASASRYRVCRYTPVRGSHPVVPAISNEAHPLDYSNVLVPLINQNFLVIRAGGTMTDPITGLPVPVAFDCPGDDSSTPLLNGNTWHHQPSS